MAQSFYTIDLQDTTFPMLSEQQTKTIIGSTAGEAPSRQQKVGVAYMHNVMPSRYGLDAISYIQLCPSLPDLPTGATFQDVRVVYSTTRERTYLAWTSQGVVYALTPLVTWKLVNTTSSAPNPQTVSLGAVNGVTYILYPRSAVLTYDSATNTLVEVPLLGIDISDIVGLTASSGYLVIVSEEAVAWSSVLDPTDFVPSQVTGAGGGNVADIAGSIIFITANSLGLLIYTLSNVVAATYTGNARFPFKFREVQGSKGGINLDRVAYEANSGEQFVYTKAGLQTITSQQATIILPEVTDFLAGRRFEDYNETTKLYELTDVALTNTMNKKIKFIASRYLVISYGLPNTDFTHALILDTALNKLGKAKIPHTDVFEFVADQTEISKETIAFLQADGCVQLLNFSTTAEANGVVILGKLQATRTRLLGLLGVEVANIPAGYPLEVHDQRVIRGKDFTNIPSAIRYEDSQSREYAFKSSAHDHSLVFTGAFNLVTALVRYTITSKR